MTTYQLQRMINQMNYALILLKNHNFHIILKSISVNLLHRFSSHCAFSIDKSEKYNYDYK